MHNRSADAVLKWMSGEASAEAVAAEHGVTVAELEQWRAVFIAGARSAPPRRGVRGTLLVAAVLAAAALGLVSREAWAAHCAQTLPSGFITFCEGEPARASEVNGNFQAALNEVRNKVGPFGSSNVVIGNGTAGATLSVPGTASIANGLNVTGAFALGGNATLNGNANLAGTLGLNATRKSCASSPCHCDSAQQFPIAWSATCSGAGIGVYSANVLQDASQRWGYDLKCITANFASLPHALNVVLFCARLSLTVQ